MLILRVASGLVYGLLVLAAVWVGDEWYLLLVVIAGLIAGLEFRGLTTQMGYHPDRGLILSLILVLILGGVYLPQEAVWGLLSMLVLLSLTFSLFSRASDPALSRGLGLAGGLYLGLLFSHFILLRGLAQGLEWTLIAFFATWAHDTTAYLVGLRWGKRPLAPRISPHKTWEGTLGGTVAATAVVVFGGVNLGRPLIDGLALGLLLSLAATLGDLSESLLKRRAGVKDSGKIIPGHGGILDRVDSLLFTVPVVYYYAKYFVGG